MARTIHSVLNKSGESRHHCLVPVLRGDAFSFSPLSMILGLLLSYIPFIFIHSFIHSFRPHRTAWGTLVPWPGIEPTPTAVESRIPNHWTAREVPVLYYKKVCCLYTHLIESFYHNSNIAFCWILPDPLLEVWSWSYDFTLCSANLVCHLIDLHRLNHSALLRWSIWSWCMVLLAYCWIQFTNILLRVFASMFIRYIGL